MQATPAPTAAVPRETARPTASTLASVIARVLPILTVAALAAAAFYIKPTAKVLTVEVPAIETRDRFYGAARLPDGALMLAGSRGKIVRSVGDTGTWKVLKTGVAVDLQDVVSLPAGGAVAVGDDGTVIATADNGDRWHRVDAGTAFKGVKLLRLALAPAGGLWTVGERGLLARSNDQGASWQVVGTGEEATYNAIAFADAGHGVVVGEFGAVLLTSDGGRTWRRGKAPGEISLMAVAFGDAGAGVAVGLDGTVMTTTDRGESWNVLTGVRREHLFGVAWRGAEWIAVGEKGVVLRGDATAVREVHGPGEIGGGWRVAVLPTPEGLVAAGAEPGLIDGTSWKPFAAAPRG
ncbi:WD40/YVTN/BNR-like repeat-containing protein [Zavarzinia sp.]|uniref:WD40/YVTN/BNR-like repeat-containing protein n=1 Tax=Zavarzinia sp. TaxID=2027920 RepID=UPI003569871C